MRRMLIWGAMVLCGAVFARAEDPPPAVDLIPSPGENLTWESDPAVYSGDQLFDYINGGAPQYIEYGFVEVASGEVVLAGRTYIFDVYDMGSPLGAFGIFSVRRPANVPRVGAHAFSSSTDYQGMVALGRYVLDISAYDSSAETATDMAQLADLAAAKLAPELLADDLIAAEPFTRLAVRGRHPGSEQLARGPVSLRAGLGAAARGPFYRAIEAVQVALARGSGEPPWWVIAGYHPRELESQTRLVLLTDAQGAARFSATATGALTGCKESWPAGEGAGMIFVAEDGSCGCVLRRGADLVFSTSTLEIETFRAWASELAIK